MISLAAGCGAARPSMATAPAAVSTDTPTLTRSLFARDPAGQLSEEAIQAILASNLELDLPARVGVLPVVEATDWRGPGPDYQIAPATLSRLAKDLPSDEAFTLVTEMLPIPSGALGMEALREIAARYKLRYIVLYRENMRRRVHVNPWAIGYATVVGALFLPGSTLHVDGYVEASLFDVKTGLLLFTVRRRVESSRTSNVWYRDDKLAELQAELAGKVAGKLAVDVRSALFAYARAMTVENEKRRQTTTPATAAEPATPAPSASAAEPATPSPGAPAAN